MTYDPNRVRKKEDIYENYQIHTSFNSFSTEACLLAQQSAADTLDSNRVVLVVEKRHQCEIQLWDVAKETMLMCWPNHWFLHLESFNLVFFPCVHKLVLISHICAEFATSMTVYSVEQHQTKEEFQISEGCVPLSMFRDETNVLCLVIQEGEDLYGVKFDESKWMFPLQPSDAAFLVFRDVYPSQNQYLDMCIRNVQCSKQGFEFNLDFLGVSQTLRYAKRTEAVESTRKSPKRWQDGFLFGTNQRFAVVNDDEHLCWLVL
jgi:hypothetical protein